MCGNLEYASTGSNAEKVILRGGSDNLAQVLISTHRSVGHATIFAAWLKCISRQCFDSPGTRGSNGYLLAIVQHLNHSDRRMKLTIKINDCAALIAELLD